MEERDSEMNRKERGEKRKRENRVTPFIYSHIIKGAHVCERVHMYISGRGYVSDNINYRMS